MVKMAIYRAKMQGEKSLPQRDLFRKNPNRQRPIGPSRSSDLGVNQKRRHMHSESVHCIVKRRSNVCEGYDERKVYGSAYAACYVVLMKEQECERIANAVAKTITKHVHRKKEVSSSQLAKLVTGELKRHNPHAAFMYETHRDLA